MENKDTLSSVEANHNKDNLVPSDIKNQPYTIIVPPTPILPIVIDGQKYTIEVFLSSKEENTLVTLSDETSSGECRSILAQFIWNKLQCNESLRPSVSEITAQPDGLFSSVIASYLKHYNDVEPFYNRLQSEDDICKRFIFAYREYMMVRVKKMAEQLSALISPLAEQVQEFSKSLQQLFSSLLESFSHLTFSMSDEERQIRKEAVTKWGEYGWTIPPWETLNFFDDVPKTLEEADKAMSPYGNSAVMQMLWDDTRKERKCKKRDFDCATTLFTERHYKACALVLFALIDGLLVRFQSNKNVSRKVGNIAIQRFKNKICANPNFDNTFLIYIEFFSVATCLETMYKPYPNFKGQPQVINRNFVVHGMATETVRRKDCVKLFYLYYNLLILI